MCVVVFVWSVFGISACKDLDWGKNSVVRCLQDDTDESLQCMQQTITDIPKENIATIGQIEKYCQGMPTKASSTDNTPSQDINWRGECYFLFADQHQIYGAMARDICDHAEDFQEDCLRHAGAREVENELFPYMQNTRVEPMKLMPKVYGILANYLPDSITKPMARDMVVRYMADQVGERFTADACRGLDDNFCAQIYIVGNLGTGAQWVSGEGQAWMLDCQGEQAFLLASNRTELAKQWKWKPWDASLDAVVVKAYTQLCQANR